MKIVFKRPAHRRRRNVPLRARHPGVRRVPQPRQRGRPTKTSSTSPASYEGVGLEVAMQYSGEFTENVHSYVNNICTIEGGTHLSGFRAAITRTHQRLRQEVGPLQGPRPQRRRLPRGADGRHLAPRARAAVRGPDQDQAGQQRDRGDRQLGGGRLPGRVSRREPQDGQDHRAERACWRPRPARAPARPGSWSASARAPSAAAACPASSATAPAATSNAASCTWSRAIRPAAAPRAAASASTRPSSPCAARSSTPTSRATTRCWPTKRSAA